MSHESGTIQRLAAAIGVVLPPPDRSQPATDQEQHEGDPAAPGTAEGERMDAAPGRVRHCDRCRGRLLLEWEPGTGDELVCLNCGRRTPVTPQAPLPRLQNETRIVNQGERWQHRRRGGNHD